LVRDSVFASTASAFYMCQQMIFKSHFGQFYLLDVIEDVGTAQNYKKLLGCCGYQLHPSLE
jgi:hypothetical protein